jgi:mannosyltransferase
VAATKAAVRSDEAGASRSAEAQTRGGRRLDVALIVAPAALAAALSLIQLTGRSLGFDESATVAIAGQHGAALRSAIAHDGGNMSGYYVLIHTLVGLFGHGTFVLRLPSVIGAAAAAALTSALALRLFDQRVALTAGVLTAVSLPLVFWGQSARSYAILVALCAASFLAFDALVHGSRPGAAWLAYVLATALALYASLMAVLIVPAQLTALAWHRRRVRAAGGALAGIAICCIPLMVLAARRGPGQLFWVPRPNLVGTKQVLEALSSAGLEPSFRTTATTFPLLALTVALLIAVVGLVIRHHRGRGEALMLSWLLVPPVLALLESLVGQSLFLPRNLLIVLPAVSILLAWALTRPPAPLALAGIAALIALRALQLAPAYGISPEQWRGATRYVLANAQPGDCVAFYPSDGRNAYRYYTGGRSEGVPRAVLPAVPWSSARAFIEDYATLSGPTLARLPSSCPRLWLVSSHEGQPDGPSQSRANRARYFQLQSELSGEYGRSAAKTFGYAAPVTVQLFSRV